MTQDAILFFSTIPKMIWSLFTSFRIPGLNFTPAVLVWGLLSFRVLVWAIMNIFSLGEGYLTEISKPSDSEFLTVSSFKDKRGEIHTRKTYTKRTRL